MFPVIIIVIFIQFQILCNITVVLNYYFSLIYTSFQLPPYHTMGIEMMWVCYGLFITKYSSPAHQTSVSTNKCVPQNICAPDLETGVLLQPHSTTVSTAKSFSYLQSWFFFNLTSTCIWKDLVWYLFIHIK